MENSNLYKLTRDEQQNSIAICKIGGYELPYDFQVDLDFDKIIASSQILDGEAVFERVSIKPIGLSISFTLRDKKETNTITVVLKQTQWVFPIEKAQEVFQQIFKKNSILEIQNTYLNKLGIQNIIIQNMKYTTKRGTTDLYVTISAMEDVYSNDKIGSTLILD